MATGGWPQFAQPGSAPSAAGVCPAGRWPSPRRAARRWRRPAGLGWPPAPRS